MNWVGKVLRSGIAALVFGALLVRVSPASAADAATDIGPDDVRLVKDIDPGPGSSDPRDFTVLGDRVLFGADDGVSGFGLWVTDGTPAGTTLVKDIWPRGFGVLGDRALFAADDGVHGAELWITDGTTAGTTLVKDIDPGPPGGVQGLINGGLGDCGFPFSLRVVGDRAFFPADDGVSGCEMWVTDGTPAGTLLVKDIAPGPGGSYPEAFVEFGDDVLFSAGDSVNGSELWATDGTSAGTRLVRDVLPGPASSWPGGLTVLGDLVLFEAETGADSRDVWATDGTAAGTRLVWDFPPGPRDGDPGRFTVFGDRALFAGSDGVSGRDLWVTDGTTASTQLVKDVWPGPMDGAPYGLTVFGDRVLFVANGGLYGRVLWATDGTTNGTVPVLDFDPGSASSVGVMTVFGDRVLFSGSDSRGSGLWVTDGTPAGTELLKDINPTGDGVAHQVVVFGDQVLFTADDGVYGTELWSVTSDLGARIDARLTRLYQAAYGRSPDSAGLDYWADRYRNGTPLPSIARSFLASAEYMAHNGAQPTNADFVDGLYQNVLGRAGDQASRNYWLRLLDTGTTRAEILVAFSESPANAARTNTPPHLSSTQAKVVRLYGAAFGRAPDIAGFSFWTDILDNRGSLTSIARQFRNSPEFTQRYGPDLDNEAFVRLLYANVLGRAPDPGGLTFWLAQLDTTYTRDQTLVAFSESPENIDRTNTNP